MMINKTFFFVALLFVSFTTDEIRAASIYSAWDHAAFLIQKYKGEYKSTFLDVMIGSAYWKSLFNKKHPPDMGWVIYESVFVVDNFPKPLAKTFATYPDMTVQEKAYVLDDIAPFIWNKLYKFESYFIPQVICNDLCLVVESFLDELGSLKQEEDSKMLAILIEENSQILRSYYLYRENKNNHTKAEFFKVLNLRYNNHLSRRRKKL